MSRPLTTKEARRMAAARTNPAGGHNGGRPKKKGKRCPCGAMTLKRARDRADRNGKGFGHDPHCSFYKEHVIIV